MFIDSNTICWNAQRRRRTKSENESGAEGAHERSESEDSFGDLVRRTLVDIWKWTKLNFKLVFEGSKRFSWQGILKVMKFKFWSNPPHPPIKNSQHVWFRKSRRLFNRGVRGVCIRFLFLKKWKIYWFFSVPKRELKIKISCSFSCVSYWAVRSFAQPQNHVFL